MVPIITIARLVYRGPGDRYLVLFKPRNWRLIAKKSYNGPCITNYLHSKYNFNIENVYFPYRLPESHSGLVITCTDKVILSQFNDSISSNLTDFTYTCHISESNYTLNPFYFALPFLPIPISSCISGNQWIRYTKNRMSLSVDSRDRSNYSSPGFAKHPLKFLTKIIKGSYCEYSIIETTSKLLFKYNIKEIKPGERIMEFTINTLDITNDLNTFLKSLNINTESDFTLSRISFPDPLFKNKRIEISEM